MRRFKSRRQAEQFARAHGTIYQCFAHGPLLCTPPFLRVLARGWTRRCRVTDTAYARRAFGIHLRWVAVSMLGVQIPGKCALSFLRDDKLGARISALFDPIPTNLHMWDPDAEVEEGSLVDKVAIWKLKNGLEKRHE